MTISTKFELWQNVALEFIHKELRGTIISIWINPSGIRYEVRYFYETKINEAYFWENEIGY